MGNVNVLGAAARPDGLTAALHLSINTAYDVYMAQIVSFFPCAKLVLFVCVFRGVGAEGILFT